MEKKYNNIEDISTSNLYRMLEMGRFQDDDSQKMIKDELKFRGIKLPFDDMINVFKGE
jgi:hypothetical protein